MHRYLAFALGLVSLSGCLSSSNDAQTEGALKTDAAVDDAGSGGSGEATGGMVNTSGGRMDDTGGTPESGGTTGDGTGGAEAMTDGSMPEPDSGTPTMAGQGLHELCGGIAGLSCAEGLVCIDALKDGCDPANGGADCAGICVTDKLCGGIAGFPCEDGLVCVDDPRDDCDPRAGGADCGGLCGPFAEANPCKPEDCKGPAPGAPNFECPDGTIAGPACMPGDRDQCIWTFVNCPDLPVKSKCLVGGCNGELCATEPLASICIAPTPEQQCLKYSNCGNYGAGGTCGWQETKPYLNCLAEIP